MERSESNVELLMTLRQTNGSFSYLSDFGRDNSNLRNSQRDPASHFERLNFLLFESIHQIDVAKSKLDDIEIIKLANSSGKIESLQFFVLNESQVDRIG